jgi:hypothetical protein
MRFAFLCGGAVGFTLAVLAGFYAQRQADAILRDAALVCLGSALLARWFWGVLDGVAEHAAGLRKAAALAVSQTDNDSAPPPSASAGSRRTSLPPQSQRNKNVTL